MAGIDTVEALNLGKYIGSELNVVRGDIWYTLPGILISESASFSQKLEGTGGSFIH